MKRCLWLLIICWFLAGRGGTAQDRPVAVPLVQLIATPEKLDRKIVAVRGYLLAVGGHGDILAHYLYLSREDAENMLGNAVVVVPSSQILRDEEKLDRMYVTLIGTFHAIPSANGSYVSTITDVVRCTVWSDPKRPIGERENNQPK